MRTCAYKPVLLLALLATGCTSRQKAAEPQAYEALPAQAPGQKKVGDFTLLGHDGRAYSLYWHGDAKAVVVIGHANGSAAIRSHHEKLRELHAKFGKRGAVFFFLNPVQGDTRAAVTKEAEASGVGFPVLLDPSQVVARELGLTSAGEAAIVDTRNWRVLYRGGLDFGDALEQVLAGRRPAAPPTAATGEPFRFRQFTRLSFNPHIVEIMRAKCQRCHSSWGHYPPFFDSFKTIKGWSSMIRETLLTDRMPPFTADTHYGSYVNDLSLTPEEKAKLVAWIDSGMERGQADGEELLDMPSRNRRKRPLEPKIWSVAMKEPQKIGPKGTVEYLFFEVGGPAPHDMWVTGLHTHSSNPRQLHHESLLVLSKPWSYYQEKLKQIRDDSLVKKHPDGDVPLWTMDVVQLELKAGEKNFTRFGAWAAGRDQPVQLARNVAYFIPKGAYLILEVHYVGTGKPDQEQTRVDLFGYTNETKPSALRRLHTMQVLNTRFEVPPGAKSFTVATNEHELKEDIEITGMLSHLHMRGRAVKFFAVGPDGKERVLASIPNFDYSWHSGFALQPMERIAVAKGSKIRAVCEYDNSPQNPRNPDATKAIRHGQTLDRAEMCKFMIAYLVAD